VPLFCFYPGFSTRKKRFFTKTTYEKSLYISYFIALKSISKSIKYLWGRLLNGSDAIKEEKRETSEH